MIYTFDEWSDHHKNFYNSFIDLKMVGWNTYSTALNEYTFGVFKSSLEIADQQVSTFGNMIKI